jgi:hypothetical protein
MLSGKKKTSGSAVAFRWLNIIFLPDEGQAPSDFFVPPRFFLITQIRKRFVA